MKTCEAKAGQSSEECWQEREIIVLFAMQTLSMPIEELPRFFPPQLENSPVAIASRESPGARRYHEPEYRHKIGRAFNWLVRTLVLPGLQDTQCGFKCFRADVVEKVFPKLTIGGWTFDVEALFIARRMGYSIQEIPIPWYYNAQ